MKLAFRVEQNVTLVGSNPMSLINLSIKILLKRFLNFHIKNIWILHLIFVMNLKMLCKTIAQILTLDFLNMFLYSTVTPRSCLTKIFRNFVLLLAQFAFARVRWPRPGMTASSLSRITKDTLRHNTSSEIQFDQHRPERYTTSLNTFYWQTQSWDISCHNCLNSLQQNAVQGRWEESYSIVWPIPARSWDQLLPSPVLVVVVTGAMYRSPASVSAGALTLEPGQGKVQVLYLFGNLWSATKRGWGDKSKKWPEKLMLCPCKLMELPL